MKTATGKAPLREQITKEVLLKEQSPKNTLQAKVKKTKTRNKGYVMDLLIHSPAAMGYIGIDGIDTAPALVRLAKVKGIDVLGITDYYEAKMVDRLRAAAEGSPVTIIPGVNIRCCVGACDDLRVSCFFPEHYGSNEISQYLQRLDLPTSAYGNSKYIVRLPLASILRITEEMEGFILPTRIDKTPARLAAIPQLVEEFGFRSFEVAYLEESTMMFKQRWPKIKFNLFSFSNATALAQVGSRISKVKMPNPGFLGIKELTLRQ